MNEMLMLAVAPAGGTVMGIPVPYLLILAGTMLASWVVQWRMKSRFAEHSQESIGLSGREVAQRMLADSGIVDVEVISVPGQLTDHYDPTKKTVNLSEAVYGQRNVAAAAVAAHECGHAVQHQQAYLWLTLRSKMVPGVNVASKMMNVLLMVFIFGAFAMKSPALLWVYVGCLGLLTLFSIVTLPVEIDASRRAMAWMRSSGVTSSIGQDRAKNALYWAAMTYVVAALSSLAMLMYYLMMLLGRRN